MSWVVTSKKNKVFLIIYISSKIIMSSPTNSKEKEVVDSREMRQNKRGGLS